MGTETRPSLLERWWECARIPLVFAAVLAGIAWLSNSSSPRTAQMKYGVPLAALIGFYLATGAAVGWIILLFGTWATSRARAALLGFFVGTLVGLVINFTILPEPVRGFIAIVPMSGIGLLLGVPIAAMYWKPSDSA